MTPTFTTHELLNVVQSWPAAGRYYVAYSGGLDSHVLLFAMHSLKSRLRCDISAIHVNHNLNERAGEWAEHCKGICSGLGIELEIVEIDAKSPKGESQEAWARKVRYEAMEAIVKQDEMLLTAHHSDDQAETLLIQLLRGSGPAGLAAMPAICRFGAGYHARPLLHYTRQQLQEFAQENEISWINDDSNKDMRFDRNLIRHEILPRLRKRWPSVTDTLSRAARLQAQSAELLEELASVDMDSCLVKEMEALDIRCLKKLSSARCSNLLRYWVKTSGFPGPDSRQSHQILTDVVDAKADANPCVSWPGAEVRRYHNYLFVMKPLPEPAGPEKRNWKLGEACRLPVGILQAYRGRGEGIRANVCPDGTLQVGFREGGEVIKREGNQHHQQLKKLFQEYDIPAWLRNYIPLLYKDDRLVSVAGKWIDQKFAAAPGEEAWQINWTIPAETSHKPESIGRNKNSDGGNKHTKAVVIDDEVMSLQLLYEKWLKKDEWLLRDEALPLLLGMDPDDKPAINKNETEKYWQEMLPAVKEARLSPVIDKHLAEAKWKAGNIDIYRWAIEAGIPVPEPLKMLMSFVLKTIKQ